MNKHKQYDILNGLDYLKVGLLSILEEMPALKEYTLEVPYFNTDLLYGIIKYVRDKNKIPVDKLYWKVGFIPKEEGGKMITKITFDSLIVYYYNIKVSVIIKKELVTFKYIEHDK